jgi:hypothetical protein
VVGDTEGLLTIGYGCKNQIIKPGRPVEQRELSVDVEVTKGSAH